MMLQKRILVMALFAVAFVLWTVQPVFAEASIMATIKKVEGKVEIKKAGTHNWVFGKVQMKMGNNDMLRTNEKSKAELEYEDGSVVVIREQSQILLNSTRARSRRLKSKYVTTFFGAIYFVVQEALPKSYVNKVYTPTAVVSIRGTSFGVAVDPKTGLTNVEVLNGTVLVKNILLNKEFFVKAGYKTQVELNKAPTTPLALRRTDIEELRRWVGEGLIRAEQDKQKRRAKRDAIVMKGKAEDKVVVAKLIDNSGFSGKWDISMGLTRMIADHLRKGSQTQVVVSKDNDLDFDELGKKHRARLVLGGEIESFELSKEAQISVEADEYREQYKAKIGILLYIVDPVSGAMNRSVRLIEEVEGEDIPNNDWKVVSKHKFDMKDAKFKNSIIGKAIAKTLKKVTFETSTYL